MPGNAQPSPAPLKYVIISPARNEADFIRLTLESVASQTHRPVKWVIVSDGSTDGTDAIVQEYTARHDWIELVQLPERRERNFAGKVGAFNAGLARVEDLEFDVLGNLDADISFDPEYFAFLMCKFAEYPGLGVGGTPFREGNNQYDYRFTSIDHVSGACQMFRRKCFEEIGGYTPIRGGGIDLVAVLTARSKGWQTRTFPEKTCLHHRPMGTATQGKLAFMLKGGGRDYALGMHPLWEVVRSMYQMTRRPFVLGGGCLLAGFVWAMVTRRKHIVPPELVTFRRAEQMQKLKRRFLGGGNRVPAA